jgi:hypothetical protein
MALRRSGVRIPMAPRPKDVAFAEANVYPRFERSSFAAPEGQVYPSRRPSCNDREVPSPWLHVPRTWLSRKRTFIPDSNAVRLLRPKGKFIQAGGHPATTARSHPHGSRSQGRGFRASERLFPIRMQFVCSTRRAVYRLETDMQRWGSRIPAKGRVSENLRSLGDTLKRFNR